MKRYAKRRPGRRFKKLSRPIMIHINGLYLEAPDDNGSLLDFVRMITHAVGTDPSDDIKLERRMVIGNLVMLDGQFYANHDLFAYRRKYVLVEKHRDNLLVWNEQNEFICLAEKSSFKPDLRRQL